MCACHPYKAFAFRKAGAPGKLNFPRIIATAIQKKVVIKARVSLV